jgi:hypothetical protein
MYEDICEYCDFAEYRKNMTDHQVECLKKFPERVTVIIRDLTNRIEELERKLNM